MNICAIDPGVKKCGVAVLHFEFDERGKIVEDLCDMTAFYCDTFDVVERAYVAFLTRPCLFGIAK